MAHYGFQVQSCNPYSGNEKGSVENKVGYVRYNFLVPSPIMNDFESLNRRLASSLRDDMERIHYEKNVRFFRVSELVEQLTKAWRDGKLSSFHARLDSADLIVLDEMGYLPLSKESAELLFHLITDWYEKKSIIITSNLEFSQWNRVFADPRLTSALVDRVIHHAHILTLHG